MTCLLSSPPIEFNFQFRCNITGIVSNRSAIRYGYSIEVKKKIDSWRFSAATDPAHSG
jgi:hypothetical protein